jgi:hypothetical protein
VTGDFIVSQQIVNENGWIDGRILGVTDPREVEWIKLGRIFKTPTILGWRAE